MGTLFTWLMVKFSIGKNFTDWAFKYALRNNPQSIKEKFNDDGQVIERETIYR